MLDIQAMCDIKIQDKAWWAFGVYYTQVDKINKMFTQLQTYEWDYYFKITFINVIPTWNFQSIIMCK